MGPEEAGSASQRDPKGATSREEWGSGEDGGAGAPAALGESIEAAAESRSRWGARGDAVGDGDQEVGFQNSGDRLLWEAERGRRRRCVPGFLLPGKMELGRFAALASAGREDGAGFFSHYRLYPLSPFFIQN